VRVKICGLTRAADAELAVRLGATDVGCVLVPGTPRQVEAAEARSLFARLPAGVRRVLVFRGATRDNVLRAAERAGTCDVQLHRTPESVAEALERFGMRVRRVIEAPAPARALVGATAERPRSIDVGAGGGGRRFDWSLLAGLDLRHVFVAGGIRPSNVRALLRHRPGGIDVSSGVESAPGRKDPRLLRSLFEQLERAPDGRESTTPRTLP